MLANEACSSFKGLASFGLKLPTLGFEDVFSSVSRNEGTALVGLGDIADDVNVVEG